MNILVKIEALDGEVITPRTGKSSCLAKIDMLPEEGGWQAFMYHNENCESPGVYIATDNIQIDGNVYTFVDVKKRPFKMTILDLDSQRTT